MRKLIRITFVAFALAAAIGLVPARAGAVGYEDSLDDCSYPKAFDALVMRPLSFTAMLAGGAVLVPFFLSIIGPAAVNSDIPQFVHMMVVPAAQFTFARPLGQCESVSAGY